MNMVGGMGLDVQKIYHSAMQIITVQFRCSSVY